MKTTGAALAVLGFPVNLGSWKQAALLVDRKRQDPQPAIGFWGGLAPTEIRIWDAGCRADGGMSYTEMQKLQLGGRYVSKDRVWEGWVEREVGGRLHVMSARPHLHGRHPPRRSHERFLFRLVS